MDIESTSEDYNRAASTRMDEEHRESLCSLERGSRRRLSLSNKVSLIKYSHPYCSVMDLEGRESRESICQHLLRDSKRFSDFRNSAASGEVYDCKSIKIQTRPMKMKHSIANPITMSNMNAPVSKTATL